jgi:hypothetical protein
MAETHKKVFSKSMGPLEGDTLGLGVLQNSLLRLYIFKVLL